MKKLIALVLALTMVFALVACGKTEAPAETPAEAPAEEVEGRVYYLNFKPEADEAWQKLAETYTNLTGVPVTVVTAASGTYETTLVAEMDKSEAPTLFQCNEGGMATWGEYCYDLSDSALFGEMANQDYVLRNADGEVISLGYCLETFGIIVNTKLLGDAGYTLDDIYNFESLKAVAEDIHARAAELGFDAFSSAGLDSGSSWRFSGHLSNMPLFYEFRDDNIAGRPATIKGTYLENYKNIWDLYTTCSATTGADLLTATMDMSTGEFKEGKAVFYQNGTWEYAGLLEAGLTDDQLAMIPIYCGVEGEEEAGLCTGTENYWSVNAEADEEDIQATLDFLYWVVTSEEGTTMMAEQFGPIPFKAAKTPENVFFAAANDLTAAGKYVVTWAFNHTPNVDAWRATVVSALAAYSADQSDAKWADVVTAFVDGWAYEYGVQNG